MTTPTPTEDDDRFLGLTAYETIETIVGDKLARRLTNLYGGKCVYFPARVNGPHWLGEAIGYAEAQKLCDHFRTANRGSLVLLPKGDIHRAQDNFSTIVAMFDHGLSTPEIASAMGLHVRSVFRARNKMVVRRSRLYAKELRRMLADNYSVPEIAQKLKMPEEVVKSVIKRFMQDKTEGRGSSHQVGKR